MSVYLHLLHSANPYGMPKKIFGVLLKKKVWFDIAQDFLVGFHDLFELNLDEKVEGVYVLFDKPFDFQERGQ